MTKIKKAIIPAAGIGSRFLPITKTFPKELFPLVDIPCLQYILQEAIDSGIEEFIFVISEEKESIKSYFTPDDELKKWLAAHGKEEYVNILTKLETQAKYSFVYQNKPLGLGHAVSRAKELIDDDYFMVILPDDIINAEIPTCKQMIDIFADQDKSVVAVMEVDWSDVNRYGIIQADPLSEKVGLVKTIIEKPQRKEAPSNLAVVGRYILSKTIFDHLEQTTAGVGGEIQITDALARLAEGPGLCCYSFDGSRYDTGTPLGLLKANIMFALKHPKYGEAARQFIKTLKV
jgi:UTP--glucose-1-phosphate uridylyltransferase